MAEASVRPVPGALPENVRAGAPSTLYLYPGELVATKDPLVVSTVLGSCVCVCLWDPETRSGGLNHFLLPFRSREDDSACRFGQPAMELLYEKVLALGCDRRRLTARMFGGASQFDSSPERPSIGAQNVTVAARFLEGAGVPLVSADVGGTRGRRISFSIASGAVSVRVL